jgi:CHAT domain-containing protein/Tfp pilus assembly protein PilF
MRLPCFAIFLPGLLLLTPVALGISNSQNNTNASIESLSAAENLRNLGNVALQQGDTAKAFEYYNQSLMIAQRLAPHSLAVAESLNGLGRAAEKSGDPPLAEKEYQQALAISKSLDPDGGDASDSLVGLGKVALDRWESTIAEGFFLQALAIRRKLNPDSLEIATILDNLGEARRLRRDLTGAKKFHRQALTIGEKRAPHSLITAASLSGLGTVAYVQADYAHAELYHRQALSIRQELAPESLLVADSLYWLGKSCSIRDLAKTEELYREALTIQQRLIPASLPVSVTLSSLSFVLLIRGDLVQAEQNQRQALAIQEKLVPHSLVVAVSLDQLGQIYSQQDNMAQAEEYARQAFEIRKKLSPASEDFALSLSSLGDFAYAHGDLFQANEYYHRALTIRGKLDFGGLLVADSLTALGRVAGARGDIAKAEEYQRRALTISERIVPGSIRAGYGLYDLGSLAYEGQHLVKAEKYYRRALAIWEKAVPQSLYVAAALGGLGEVAWSRHELDRAEEYYRRELEIEEKVAPGGLDNAGSLNDLADLFRDRGEWAKAEQYYRRSLAIREKLAPGSIVHAETLAALAGIMRETNQAEAAMQLYGQALNALESQTARLGGGDEIRTGYRAKHGGFYKDYIDLLIDQKQTELAFQVMERSRARTLVEMLTNAHVDIRQGIDPSLLKQERMLQQALTNYAQRRMRLLGEKHSEERMAELNKEAQDLRAQYARVEEQIRVNSPGYAALTQPQALSAREVQQQLLDGDTLLLEYALGEKRSYLFIVAWNSLSAYELPGRTKIESAARRLYQILTARNRVIKGETEFQWQTRSLEAEKAYPALAAALSQMVLGPAAQELPGKRLLIVSDGALEYIPFGALPIPGMDASKAEPLVLKHEIVNLPSASAFAVLRHQEIGRPPASRSVAVFADPVFDKDDIRVAVRDKKPGLFPPATNNENSDRLTRSLADVNQGLVLSRLRFSRQEARAIMAIAPGKVQAFLDFDANRQTVTSRGLQQYRIVHFATHGLLDSQHPELSGLILSLVDHQGRPRNGFLDLQDIYNLNLSADLVVLSACETGLGKQINGEGLVGLTRGFMYAGARRVVASLWNVSDVATARLMEQFYRAMEKDRLRPAAALQAAQIALWKQDRWRSPYYWAAFQIQGQWR